MTRTGVDSLDRSIDKTNAWLADVAAKFGTEDRRLAYRVTRSWLHTLRDRLPVTIAAHVAAQLPELLRGVFYEGWNPSKVPVKYSKDEYIARFARDAQVHHDEVPRSGRLVTSAMRRHISAGAIDEALGALPADIRHLLESPDRAEQLQAGVPQQAGAAQQAGASQQASTPEQAGASQQAGTGSRGPAGERSPADRGSPAGRGSRGGKPRPIHDLNPSPGGGEQ
jgi:uncharacterized protein (DUF2267 family)